MDLKKQNNFIEQIFQDNWNEDFIFDGIENRIISYGQFYLAVNNFCNQIPSFKTPGERIVVISENSISFIVVLFSALAKNQTFIPIDPQLSSSVKMKLLSIIKPTLVIDSTSTLEKSIPMPKNIFDNLKCKEVSGLFESIDFNKEFLITFSSGTTGIPKGIVHSFKNLILSSLAFNERFQFDEKSIFFHNLSMSYMAGILNCIFLPFVCKSKIIIDKKFSVLQIPNFWELSTKFYANVFWFVPTELELLLKLDPKNGRNLGLVEKNIIGLVATAPLDEKTKFNFQSKYGIHLFESYGLSETLFVSTNFLEHDKTNYCGKILSDVEIIFGKDHEILIKTPWLLKRYLGSNQNLSDKFFETGDLGRKNSEGFLKVLGRKKDLIIKGGINISPKQVHDCILNLDIIKQIMIVGIKDRIMGEKIICFYIKEIESPTNIEKIINSEITSKLGSTYCIDEFVQLEEFPKTFSGKIDKNLLVNNYTNSFNQK